MPKSSSRPPPPRPETLVDTFQHDLGRVLIADPEQGVRLDLSRLTPDEVGLLDRLEARVHSPDKTGDGSHQIRLRIRLPDRLNAIRTLIRSTEQAPDTTEER